MQTSRWGDEQGDEHKSGLCIMQLKVAAHENRVVSNMAERSEGEAGVGGGELSML